LITTGAVLALAYVVYQRPLERNRPIYAKVIDQLQQGALKSNPSGPIRLPGSLRRASVDGEIYVSRPSTNQLLVVFKTWKGKGRNMEGLLYSSQMIAVPTVGKDYYGNLTVSVGPIALVLEKQIDSNWHRVSYRLD